MYFQQFQTKLTTLLNSSQKTVLRHLIAATKKIDQIFVEQISKDNYGYPRRIRKEEILEQSQRNKLLLSHYTIVKRTSHNQLKAIRYEKHYRSQLIFIAKHLDEASKICKNEEFKNFLNQKGKDLLEGRYLRGETMWVKMKNNYPINLAIGPLLTYHDRFFGIKTFYSSAVYLRDLKKEAFYQKIVEKIRKRSSQIISPFPDFIPKEERVEVGDVVAYGGEVAKMKATAWSRPSAQTESRQIIQKYGSKKILFENMIKLRFKKLALLLYKKLFSSPSSVKNLLNNAVLGTLLHEIGHGYGQYKNATSRLENLFWQFEELKCDLFALCISYDLIKENLISEKDHCLLIKSIICDILAQYKLAQKIKERKSHAYSTQYLITSLIKDGVLHPEKNRYRIDYFLLKENSKNYLHEILKILSLFSKQEAKRFIKMTKSNVKRLGADKILKSL